MTSAKSRCVVFLMTFVMAQCVPLDFTTSRSLHFEPIERSGNQLMEIRKSSDDLVLDTRTPPKIRAQTKKKEKVEQMEFSHAGVAIPVDEDSIKLEETTKKLSFYKVQRPTTNSGLSTWILLSGDPATTTPKTTNESETEHMKVIKLSDTRLVKPVFKNKQRTTTITPTTPSTQKTKAASESTRKPKPSPLVKIKASTLNNAKKKNDTKTIGTSIKEVTEHPTEKTKVTLFNRLTNIKTTTTEKSNSETSTLKDGDKTTSAISSTTIKNAIDSQHLTLEAKEGDSNITEAPVGNKKKKNKTRKNKNKNKKRKPQEKTTNSTSTKLTKNKNHIKEKPLGTQIYNYLSREMMPTLGVGLVGLMVTAGLASYFLYPFGAARRVYEVDRKDKGGAYYYNDIYSGGIAEEEAFGKVIAGMPLEKLQSSLYSNTQPTRRPMGHKQNNYYPPQQNHQNHHKHQSQQQNTKTYQAQPKFNNHNHNKQNVMVQGTVESVPLGPTKDSYLVNSFNKDSYQLVNYKSNEVDPTRDSEINMDKKFVVGNAPKGGIEEVTPAAVPEHGPRMLKLRRRKREVDDMENDIYSDKKITDMIINETTEMPTTIDDKSDVFTTDLPISTTSTATESLDDKVHSVFDLVKDIFHLKISLGLELVKNATRSISNYIDKVQTKLDTHYRTTHSFFIR
ncbi:uncharacterized protein LOC123684032 isoform X2 [Harmonia axyridis]|uniref:uncharacterized protein LOC123684032 isoform X2 n=1 Tax=Harmonia axyridis TaxID=115357 RepID=UPI001E276D9E|nr:uncharacterized protein LOC123684032 isoform X2 [Harmonia axyridis]